MKERKPIKSSEKRRNQDIVNAVAMDTAMGIVIDLVTRMEME